VLDKHTRLSKRVPEREPKRMELAQIGARNFRSAGVRSSRGAMGIGTECPDRWPTVSRERSFRCSVQDCQIRGARNFDIEIVPSTRKTLADFGPFPGRLSNRTKERSGGRNPSEPCRVGSLSCGTTLPTSLLTVRVNFQIPKRNKLSGSVQERIDFRMGERL
jgi:hypothetical protein